LFSGGVSDFVRRNLHQIGTRWLLEAPPVSRLYASREAMYSPEASSYRQQLRAKHSTLRAQIASRGLLVTGEADTLINALFVAMPKGARGAELASCPALPAWCRCVITNSSSIAR